MRLLLTITTTALAIDPSAAGLVTAIVGGIVGVGGLMLNRFSQREQARQQSVADQAAKDSRDLSETQQALDATVKRAELAEAGEERKQTIIDTKQARIERLEEALDEQRSLYRSMYSAQEARCRDVTGDLVDTLINMRGVVRDEITRAAVESAVDDFVPHPHEIPRAIEPKPDPS